MEIFNNDLAFQAKKYKNSKIEYSNELRELLKGVCQCYKLLIKDKIRVSRSENMIRDILVDDYLSKNIKNYKFKKEETSNLGRVDIFIQKTFTDEKPDFIIECKILDNKNTDGIEGLNAKYIKNGIQRFLSEHYYSYNDFYINAMIGFVVDKMDIVQNIASINNLSKKILNNLVEITQDIELIESKVYQSQYKSYNNKEFIIYHQMMDFSNNIIIKESV